MTTFEEAQEAVGQAGLVVTTLAQNEKGLWRASMYLHKNTPRPKEDPYGTGMRHGPFQPTAAEALLAAISTNPQSGEYRQTTTEKTTAYGEVKEPSLRVLVASGQVKARPVNENINARAVLNLVMRETGLPALLEWEAAQAALREVLDHD